LSKMKESVDIIIAGVGGQGNVLASQIYAAAAVEAGLKVAVGETYGAAQRGGSVVSHLRISEDCKYGPLIPRGRAEAIVGLEPLEALRVLLEYGNCQTMVVTNDRLNYPLGVLTGGDEYPSLERLTEAMRRTARKVCVLPATEMAKEAGNAVAANVVLTGALAAAGVAPIPMGTFRRVIEMRFGGETRMLNLKAFELGAECQVSW